MGIRRIWTFALGQTVWLVPTMLHAAETVEEAGGDHGGGGMPHLDTATYTSQIFWLALTFGLLYYLLNKKLLPKVSETLEARQDRINKDLDRAAELRVEAEEVLRNYEALVGKAHADAQAQIKAKRDELATEAAERQAKLDAELAGQISEAEKRIQAERDKALEELQAVAIGVAQTATQKLIGESVSEKEAKSAVAAALKEAA